MSIDDFLQSNHLQLWFSRVSDATRCAEDRVREWLSVSEKERLRCIRQERKAREYLLSRALMRNALSRQFQLSEDEWQFVEYSARPPVVENLPPDTWLSLSHSQGYLCFALASCRIGIDIEVSKADRDFVATAEMFMDTDEHGRLQDNSMPPAEFFYRVWCAKEACFKSLNKVQQASTTLRSISYATLRQGLGRGNLIEGASADFRFAAVTEQLPKTIEQHCFKVPLSITLEPDLPAQGTPDEPGQGGPIP